MAGSAARGGPSCRVNAITSADYPTPVRRPADSRLDGSRLEQVYGIRLPHWHDALDRCLDTIYQQEHKERDA
jgi:dTDP-4-dehydrorhamnose reductase